MNCEETLKLIDGYVDAELDPITGEKLERHLRDCPRCRVAYEAQRALMGAIRTAAPYYSAPSELRHRIQSSLRSEIESGSARNADLGRALIRPEAKTGRSPLPITHWNWLAIAAVLLFVAIVTWNLAPRTRPTDGEEFLAAQLIASHVRSLMANHLTDVASSDQHTVKPWLDERLDFAAPVLDLTSNGFPLVGGRLDYLDNRPVAALVYQRRKHYINLFIWLRDPKPTGGTETISRQGYHLLHWLDPDFNYWAVSDVSANDLQTFKQSFEKQLPRR